MAHADAVPMDSAAHRQLVQVLSEYTGRELVAADLEAYADPVHPDVYAVRDEEGEYHLVRLNVPDPVATVEWVEFAQWPPKAGGRFVHLTNG